MKKKKVSKIGFEVGNATKPDPFLETTWSEAIDDAFTPDQVSIVMRWVGIPEQEFFKWIDGQTGIILPNGNLAYYRSDVEYFVQKKLAGNRIVPVID